MFVLATQRPVEKEGGGVPPSQAGRLRYEPFSTQFLLELQHWRKQIAIFLSAAQDVIGREYQLLGLLRFRHAFDIFPIDRRRDRGTFLRAERVRSHSRLMLVVLAPVDEDLPL